MRITAFQDCQSPSCSGLALAGRPAAEAMSIEPGPTGSVETEYDWNRNQDNREIDRRQLVRGDWCG